VYSFTKALIDSEIADSIQKRLNQLSKQEEYIVKEISAVGFK